MAELTMTITGMEETYASLQKLPALILDKVIRRSMTRAAALMRDASRAAAPVHAGEYKNSTARSKHTVLTKRMTAKVMAKSERSSAKGFGAMSADQIAATTTAKVMAKIQSRRRTSGTLKKGIIIGRPAKQFDASVYIETRAVKLSKTAFYGRWIERGWKHKTSKRGKSGDVTNIAGRPFMQTAFEKTRTEAIYLFADTLKKLTAAGIKKLGAA